MAFITIPNVFTFDTIIDQTQMNANFTAITAQVNGALDNTNIASNAAIAITKLALAPGGAALNKTTTGNATWASALTTDTNAQIQMTSDAGLQFGPGGSTAVDVRLKRSAANTLQLAKADGSTGATLDMHSGTISNFTLGSAVPVSAGGTGLATITSGSFMTGNGTGAVALIANPLPTANGGTGSALFSFSTATFPTANAVTVTDATVTANTVIIPCVKASSALAEEFSYSLSAGVSFTLHSTNASSTAVVGYIRIG